MDKLHKLFNDIQIQSNDRSKKYRKLNICKYSFKTVKVIILSLSTGLAFINVFAILSVISIPIIDILHHNSDVHNRFIISKLKKVCTENC